MFGLTLRFPWPEAVVELGKNVENRVWRTSYRGPVAIHVGRSVDAQAPAGVLDALTRRLPSGHIVAVVELRDIVRDSVSQWAREDHFHWVLDGTRALVRPIPCMGRQGLFRLPEEVSADLAVALAHPVGQE